MRNVKPGMHAQRDDDTWCTVKSVTTEQGHTTIIYTDGVDESAPADTPVVVGDPPRPG